MANENRLHNISIHWSYPRVIENIESDWKCNENGLYYISRIYNNVESPVYIGETKRDFITRIDEHYQKVSDFFNRRGIKKIRLGTIVKPQNLSSYDEKETKHLLQTIESRLVEYLRKNGYGKYLCNIRQVNSYTEWFKLNIENIGYRGSLPKFLQFEP